MTTRPRPVPFDRGLLPGLAAVALFAIMAAVFLAADTSVLVESWGFPQDESVVGSIGASLIGIEAAIPVESFVVALLVIAIALDAALDGSLMLAKRDEAAVGGDPVTDGGEPATGDGSTTEDGPTTGDGSTTGGGRESPASDDEGGDR